MPYLKYIQAYIIHEKRLLLEWFGLREGGQGKIYDSIFVFITQASPDVNMLLYVAGLRDTAFIT